MKPRVSMEHLSQKEKALSWPVGLIVAPFVVLFTVAVCVFTCFAIVLAALFGKLKVTKGD